MQKHVHVLQNTKISDKSPDGCTVESILDCDAVMEELSKKQCVLTLMKFLREENRDIQNNGVVLRSNVPHVIYKCPRGALCKNANQEVAFQKGRGFTNPFDHLVSCYKSKSKIYAQVLRIEAGSKNPVSSIENLATDKDKAMFAYMQLVVMRNAPISCVEDPLYRNFSMYDHKFSREYFTSVLYALVRIIEDEISEEMKLTRGAILHDGGTFSGMHYIGLFASYVRKISPSQTEVVSPLLSMSPMARICSLRVMIVHAVMKQLNLTLVLIESITKVYFICSG